MLPAAREGNLITANLKGKAVLVTGGASGIGLATVRQFAASGARVAVNFLPQDSAGHSVVEELRANKLDVLPAPGDVSDPIDAVRMTESAIAHLGRLDALVNNAGTPATAKTPIPFENLDEMTEEFWTKVLSTNLVGAFRCARAAASALKSSKGAIVNTASVAGLGRRGSSLAYAASKAGLINLTIGLARALSPDVRVNAVAPGLIETPWTEGWSAARKQQTADRTLLQRLGNPSEVAEAVFFLVAGARYINGQILVVDGGAN